MHYGSIQARINVIVKFESVLDSSHITQHCKLFISQVSLPHIIIDSLIYLSKYLATFISIFLSAHLKFSQHQCKLYEHYMDWKTITVWHSTKV